MGFFLLYLSNFITNSTTWWRNAYDSSKIKVSSGSSVTDIIFHVFRDNHKELLGMKLKGNFGLEIFTQEPN